MVWRQHVNHLIGADIRGEVDRAVMDPAEFDTATQLVGKHAVEYLVLLMCLPVAGEAEPDGPVAAVASPPVV